MARQICQPSPAFGRAQENAAHPPESSAAEDPPARRVAAWLQRAAVRPFHAAVPTARSGGPWRAHWPFLARAGPLPVDASGDPSRQSVLDRKIMIARRTTYGMALALILVIGAFNALALNKG